MRRLLVEYNEFLHQIAEIRDFLLNINISDDVAKLKTPESDRLIEFFKRLRYSSVAYNAIIISSYACYENYVDNLLGAYLQILSDNTQTYDELPKELKEKYQEKLGEYLSNPQRFSRMDLKLNEEIANYNVLLNDHLPRPINRNLALSHSRNLHEKEVFDLMKRLGIPNSKDSVLDSMTFKKYWLEHGMDDVEFSAKRSRENDDLFLPLESLVIQRNEVAHTWKVDDRLSMGDISNNIIPFVCMFAECLFYVCVRSAFFVSKMPSAFEVETPIKVIHNNILCFNNQYQNIKIDDYIIYLSGEVIKIAQVKKIQCNGKSLEKVDRTEAIDIGVELTNRIKETDKLKMILSQS